MYEIKRNIKSVLKIMTFWNIFTNDKALV